jgi:glycosyltransferase involved in cell wall biosynthesis
LLTGLVEGNMSSRAEGGKARVSIGLPVFNGGALFAPAVESLLAQDLADLELILADNGSDDGTLEQCRRFAAADPRVRVLTSDVNRGAAWNFNRCVAAASAPMFKWAAHDDLYRSDFLSRCVEVLDSCPDVAVAFTRTVEIDGDGGELLRHGELNVAGADDPVDRFRAVLLDEVYCYSVFGLVRTADLRQTALIRPYSASDRVLLAELALHGRFVELAAPCFLHREHQGRSMYAYTNDRERMRWFDPDARTDAAMTLWHQAAGYARGIHRSAPLLSAGEQRRAWQALARWTAHQAGPMARQLATRTRSLVRDRAHAARSVQQRAA